MTSSWRWPLLLIAESHLSVHTWPETGFASVDIFTCGEEMDAEVAIRVLEEGLKASSVVVREQIRGRLAEEGRVEARGA